MSLRRFLLLSLAPLYAALVAALIVLLSGSSYDFMIGGKSFENICCSRNHLTFSVAYGSRQAHFREKDFAQLLRR